MEINIAIDRLAALAHESRLKIYRYLVKQGRSGAPAGAIAAFAGLPGATLNFHLEQLVSAGLASRERRGRNVNYAAVFPAVDELIGYLTENCCATEGAAKDTPDQADDCC